MEKWVVMAKKADFQEISREFGIDQVWNFGGTSFSMAYEGYEKSSGNSVGKN